MNWRIYNQDYQFQKCDEIHLWENYLLSWIFLLYYFESWEWKSQFENIDIEKRLIKNLRRENIINKNK